MSIKVKKACLEATLNVLELQKKADAAMAKAEMMEFAAAQLNAEEQIREFDFLPTQATQDRKVTDYINKHNHADLPQ